ncbi:MAG: hypothetical protein IPJ88_15475 [Myxococcales bacterium]|nr:MAG: hypothetical protein IPJ88_15475 [Myxococcales bacterium]
MGTLFPTLGRRDALVSCTECTYWGVYMHNKLFFCSNTLVTMIAVLFIASCAAQSASDDLGESLTEEQQAFVANYMGNQYGATFDGDPRVEALQHALTSATGLELGEWKGVIPFKMAHKWLGK